MRDRAEDEQEDDADEQPTKRNKNPTVVPPSAGAMVNGLNVTAGPSPGEHPGVMALDHCTSYKPAAAVTLGGMSKPLRPYTAAKLLRAYIRWSVTCPTWPP